jgi:hypothetical protein
LHSAKNALKSSGNVEYIVESSNLSRSIQIVDLDTGRISAQSRWNAGLHEFLEIKHDIIAQHERITPISLSNTVFYKFYKTISALTGTAERVQTKHLYQIKSFDVPPHRTQKRIDHLPILVDSKAEANLAIVEQILFMKKKERPVLILCSTIKQSEELALEMKKQGIDFHLLNEIQEKDEELILSDSGNPGIVTIATNNAGRGTDIKPSEISLSNGGLHVILTFYPESERVEDQAIGRAGRQGQPGSSQMIITLESHDLSKKSLRISDEDLLHILSSRRTLKENFEKTYNYKFVESELFLAEKTEVFFLAFQKWSLLFENDVKIDAICNQIKQSIINKSTIELPSCNEVDLKLFSEYLKLLSTNTNFFGWKIFLNKVVERMKKKIVNDWVEVIFAPSEKQLRENLNDNEKLLKAKQEIDINFAKFRLYFEQFLNQDGSGILFYLNQIVPSKSVL